MLTAVSIRHCLILKKSEHVLLVAHWGPRPYDDIEVPITSMHIYSSMKFEGSKNRYPPLYTCSKAHIHIHPPKKPLWLIENSVMLLFHFLEKIGYLSVILVNHSQWPMTWVKPGTSPWGKKLQLRGAPRSQVFLSQGQLHWCLRNTALESLDSWSWVKDYQKCCMPGSCLRQMAWLTSLPKLTILML